MTIKVAIIDGTGAKDNYDAAMAKSFCRTLSNQLGGDAYYQRGPTAAGCETLPEATRAVAWIRREHARDSSIQIMLVGYSRGGSAAILAAQMLEYLNISVHSLFLFDPVARHIFPGGEVIPANVAFSRVARRDQSWRFVMKYEGAMSDGKRLGATSNPTRPSFGNTGLNWRGVGDHQAPTVFTGSHGALGGVGWAFVKEDQSCQLQVSAWMGQQMRSRGLIVSLGPGSLDAAKPSEPGVLTRMAGQVLDATMLAKSALNRLGAGGTGY